MISEVLPININDNKCIHQVWSELIISFPENSQKPPSSGIYSPPEDCNSAKAAKNLVILIIHLIHLQTKFTMNWEISFPRWWHCPRGPQLDQSGPKFNHFWKITQQVINQVWGILSAKFSDNDWQLQIPTIFSFFAAREPKLSQYGIKMEPSLKT